MLFIIWEGGGSKGGGSKTSRDMYEVSFSWKHENKGLSAPSLP